MYMRDVESVEIVLYLFHITAKLTENNVQSYREDGIVCLSYHVI